MKIIALLTLFITSLSSAVHAASPNNSCPEFLNADFKQLHSSKTVNLCDVYDNKPMVIVNTASHCGYTKQFKGLEKLYKKYKNAGIEIVGFSSDSFNQAAKNEEEAATVCYKNYGVTFTMLAPTEVRGKKANSVFSYLGSKSSQPSWNFNKYLISADGNTIKHYGSRTKPLEDKLEEDLQAMLTASK